MGEEYGYTIRTVWVTVFCKGEVSFMLKIKARTNESVEQMLKRFKKLCEKEGLTKEIKRVSYYEKPSERRRRRVRKAQRKELREQMFKA